MNRATENFETFADIRNQSIKPFQKFANVSLYAFEKVARENYTIFGDVLEFTVNQAKVMVDSSGNPKEIIERQIANSQEFAHLMNKRVTRYFELSKDLQNSASEIVQEDLVEPADRTAKKQAKKAS